MNNNNYKGIDYPTINDDFQPLMLQETQSDLDGGQNVFPNPQDSSTSILDSLSDIPDKKFRKFIRDLSSLLVSESHY